jgi:predicted RNase H-related nuclease YkuK (DUF458 family)
MIKKFRKTNGELVDALKHTLEILNKYPSVKIHVGTDSQNKKGITKYATVIAYRYGTRGVHYIYLKQKFPKIKNRWDKLWRETVFSIEAAVWLRDQINLDIVIDMDYSDEKENWSNKLVNSAKGWAESLGFKVNIKPYNQIATKAADYECR